MKQDNNKDSNTPGVDFHAESYLKKAVRVKWITEEEMEQIKLAKVEADKINVE